MTRGALAPVSRVLIDLRAPAYESMKVVGCVDIALSIESRMLAEHQQITTAIELIDARLQHHVVQHRRQIGASLDTGCNQCLDLALGQATFVEGPFAGHRLTPRTQRPSRKIAPVRSG